MFILVKDEKENRMKDTVEIQREAIERYCKILRWGCDGLFVLVLTMATLQFTAFSSFAVFGFPGKPELLIGSSLMSDALVLETSVFEDLQLLICNYVPWLIYLLFIYQFRRLFVAYGESDSFTLQKTQWLRNIGLLAIASEFTQLLGKAIEARIFNKNILASMAEKPISELAGITREPSAVLSVNLSVILIGVGLFVLSLILKRAVALEEERRLTV